MSKSAKTLKVQKGNTVYTCDLYTTTEEAKVYGASNYLPVNSGGTNLYAPLYPATGWSQDFYDNYGTPLHISKSGYEYVLAQKSLIQLGITAVANQTITVTTNINGVYSSPSWTSGNRYFPYDTTWTATVSGNTGWNAGTLSASSGTLTNANITVTASAATHKTYKITLTQKANETVTIHYKNHNGTSLASSWSTATASVTLGHGSQYYLTIAADTGYTAGTITSAGSSSSPNTLTAATTVSFTAATLKSYVLTLAATSHQTIKIRYKNRAANGTLPDSWSSEISSGSSAKTYTLRHGSKYQITSFSASTGWTAGSLKNGSTVVSASTSTTYTMTAAITVSATSATHKTFTLTHKASNTHQTLTVKYKNYNGSSFGSETTLASGKSATVGYGTTWTATLTPDTNYNAGTLSPGSSGTVKANTTISATAGTIKKFKVTFNSNVSVSIKSGSSYTSITSGTSVAYGTTVKVTSGNPAPADYMRITTTKGGNSWTENSGFTSGQSFTFTMPAASVGITGTPYYEGGGS